MVRRHEQKEYSSEPCFSHHSIDTKSSHGRRKSKTGHVKREFKIEAEHRTRHREKVAHGVLDRLMNQAERAASLMPRSRMALSSRIILMILRDARPTIPTETMARIVVMMTTATDVEKWTDLGCSYVVAKALDGLARASSDLVVWRWRTMLEVSGEREKTLVRRLRRKVFPPTSSDESWSFSRSTQDGGAPSGIRVIFPADVRPTVFSLEKMIIAVGNSATFVK